MKHKLKKLWPLLLCLIFPLLLASCSLEERVSIDSNPDGITSRIISYEELKGMPKVIDKLNSIKARNKRLAYSSKYNFMVDTDRILLVEKDEYQSLSFPIYRDTIKGYMENLFLHPHKGGYLAFLARYDLTVKDLASLDEGTPNDENLLLNMQIIPLEDLDMD